MTRDKAIKLATRQRMARTGEPYVVARRAVTEADDPRTDAIPDVTATAEAQGPLGLQTAAAAPAADHDLSAPAAAVPTAAVSAEPEPTRVPAGSLPTASVPTPAIPAGTASPAGAAGAAGSAVRLWRPVAARRAGATGTARSSRQAGRARWPGQAGPIPVRSGLA
jgi:hypothetical protein